MLNLRRVLAPALVALATFAAPMASASDLESELLFSRGAWEVEVTYDPGDESFWCSASTFNRTNQSFSLVAYDNGGFLLLVGDPVWRLSERPIRFLVDIDRSRWTIDGDAEDSYVSLMMNDADKAFRFVQQLMGGNAVAVLNDTEKRLATFSLSGSYAAITQLMDCWDKISNRDPFSNGSSADPF